MRVEFAEGVRKAFGYKFPRMGKQAFDIFFLSMPRKANVELFPGIKVPLNFQDDTQKTTYWQGERFETPTPDFLLNWSKSATHFFDIGSNYGFFSFMMLARCPEIEVHSFEPNPDTFKLVQSAKDNNKLARMFPHNLGMGDKEEKLDLFRGVEDSGHSTFGQHPELAVKSPFKSIQIVSFDDFVQERDLQMPERPLWVAKIDVEGFEVKVLRGMKKALGSKVFRGLVVEINPFTLNFCKAGAEEVFDIMDSFGYVASSRGVTRSTLAQGGNAFFELKG